MRRLSFIVFVFSVSFPLFALAETSCPQPIRNLSFGSRGSDVIQLQQYLISQNLLAADSATGYFGRLTEASVQQWQAARGIVSSGTPASTGYGAVGPRTRAAIAGCGSSVSAVSTGSSSSVAELIQSLMEQVQVLQARLAALKAQQSTAPDQVAEVSGTLFPAAVTGTSASCSFNGQTVQNGSSVTAYQSSSVSSGSCVSQQRTCTNGTLSGSYTYNSCTVSSTALAVTLSQSANTTTSDGTIGQNFTVSWSSTGASSCTVQKSAPDGTTSTSWAAGTFGSQSASPYQAGTHHWWIDCTGTNGGTAHQDMYHTVASSDSQPYPNGFQIIIGTNQLYLSESAQISRIVADGVSSIPYNSGPWPTIPTNEMIPMKNWPTILRDLNSETYSDSGDNPGGTTQADFVSASIGRLVDGEMAYQENGMDVTTTISNQEINTYAAHVVPGYGPLGPRIIVLARNYGDTAHQQALQRALANPNVSGAEFEFIPGNSSSASWMPPWSLDPAYQLDAACQYTLSLHKKCYFLIGPGPHATDYLGDVQEAIAYFAPSGVLKNPNTYLIISVEGRPVIQHFLSTGSGDRNSVEAVVNWLKAYRASGMAANYSPRGYLDSADYCDNIFGWAQDQDTSDSPVKVNFWIDTVGTVSGWGGQVIADQYRSDLCSAIGSCYHGFTFSIPAQFRDGRQHQLFAYAIDADDVNYAQLSASPKTFHCNQ